MPIPINISLFAHILLDSELSGRFGVQGNTFSNTFGYLNQYFKTLPNMPHEVQKLAAAMDALVRRENIIKTLRPDLPATKKTLEKFTSTTLGEINNLKPGQDLLLPGGWMGGDSPGHAMIYQFEKNAEGELLFSIYNSGSGLEFHEKTSSKEKELFSPVKTYKLHEPINQKELQNLVSRLVIPKFKPLPFPKNWDAETLYHQIDASLAFLKAEHISQDLTTPGATTASQLSGTCAQRSIHQMLKINFETLPEYQRFIFDFKMYALKDFIATHPAPPRSPKITAFVQKAIINNLKILQEPGVFTDEQEKDRIVQELKDLQQQLQTNEQKQKVISSFFNFKANFDSMFNFVNSFCERFIPNELIMKIASFDTTNTENETSPSLLPAPRKNNLLSDLADVITQCKAQKDKNSLWVMTQIEQTVLQLPIPSSCNEKKPYYEPIPFYNTMTSVEYDSIANTLDELHALYEEASKKTLREATLPTQLLTRCSLLALRDYFAVTREASTNTPDSHLYLHSKLTQFFSTFRAYPYLATNHPAGDQRVVDLLNNTKMHVTQPSLDKDRFPPLFGAIPDPVTDYQILLDTEPDLKKSLEELYTSQKHKNNNFHQSIRSENLTALFTLFNEFDSYGQLNNKSVLATDRFKPLIKKIQQRFALENASMSYLAPLKTGGKIIFYTGNREINSTNTNGFGRGGCGCGTYGDLKTLSFNPDSMTIDPARSNGNTWICKFIFGRYLDSWYPVSPEEKKCITQHKYNVPESPAQLALLESYYFYSSAGFKNSNEIQLSSLDKKSKIGIIDKNNYFMRDLFQLRLSPAHQIKLTLDYFNKSESIGHLLDRSVQLYVEANVFEPGLLITTLKDDPAFLTRFNAFIHHGLHYFMGSDGLLSQESLFFIQLRINVHGYAALNRADATSIQRLQDDHDELNKLMKLQTDPLILASLHRYRFSNAMTLYQLKSVDETLLRDAFLSYVSLQAKQNPYHPDDTAMRFEQQRAGLHLKDWLRSAHPETIQSLVDAMMNSLGVNVAHLRCVNEYPKFHYQDEAGTTVYTVNVELGRVFQNGYSLTATPLDIINHPVTRRLGLNNESSCWLSEDENTILFKTGNVRMKKVSAALVIQKQWMGQWYELKPLTDKQQFLLGLEATDVVKNKLSAILTDASIEAWVSETDTLLAQNQKPIYRVERSGSILQLDQNGLSNGCILTMPSSTYVKALTQFEDPGFFRVNLDQTTKTQGTIEFARYGLTLNISDNQITLPDTNYVLMPPETSALGSDIACLSFSNDKDQIALVAVQPFYVAEPTRQMTGDYYKSTHDTTGHIAHYLLTEKTPEKDQPAWNHHNSQRVITYKIVNGEPKPDSAADALYLCYLYLASHETDKAWSVLNDISQRMSLSGSLDELTFLSWIIETLPFVETEEKHKIATPEYVACQLKALALYTDYLTLGQPPIFPKDKSFDTTSANGINESICFESAKEFYKGLPETVNDLYERHQRGERHLDKKYTLRDEECKSLLHYCDPDSSIALGSLGYERRRLSLKTLLKEYQRLIALRDTSPDFPPKFVKRLVDIEKNITNELRIMKKSTKLKWIPLDLTLPKSFKINEQTLSKEVNGVVQQWRYDDVFTNSMNEQIALNTLNSVIEEDDFIRYYSTYLHIARSGSAEQKAELKQFCLSYLNAFRHVRVTDDDRNMPYLTNILYRVLENPVAFPSEKKITLGELIQIASSCDVAPIIVPQAMDVFDDILTTNQDIWDELSREMLACESMPALTSIYPEPLRKTLKMADALHGYRAEENEYTEQLNQLLHDGADEKTAGQLKYACIQMQRGIAETALQRPEVRARLSHRATTLEIKQQKDLDRIWENAIRLANKTPHDLADARERHIQLLAKQRQELTQKELLTLYFHADLSLYIEKTGLSREACIGLHQVIHKTLSIEVQHQQTTRLLNALDEASRKSPPEASHLHQIATALMSENTPDAQTDPALMLFQYAENILVRPRQVQAIKSLLSTDKNVVEKLIPGGGKSKVILPMLAQQKATGLNFVVVEVPRALLATNHVDLNSTSQRLFGQKAHRFEFNRDSDSSPERLASIYQQFVEIMTNKDYLVTTGESMQSLELKYLELLLDRPKETYQIKTWEKQVYWASKITSLLKQRGDVVIDEVHQGLLLKKKLNYTLGDMRAISPELIHHSIALYQFVDTLDGKSLTIDDLLTHSSSPLRHYIDTLNYPNVTKELSAYFNNKAMPSFIERLDPDVKDALAFYKEQLTLLPKTRARHYKENYGPSEVQDSALKRSLAIPYMASNQPNERSRFGSPFAFETINYSIQSLLTEGLNVELLNGAIVQWQTEARNELLTPSSPYNSMADTPTAQRINELLKGSGFTLQMINFRSKTGQQQLDTLFEHLKHNRAVLYTLLQEQILPQITLEQSILHSDPLNHVSMFDKVSGLSGTPSNHTTYHHCLQYNPLTSLGTDGYIQTVLEKKTTPVTRVPFTNIDAFLPQLFQDKNNVRAIIDINATFAGFSNLEVAHKLAQYSIGQIPPIKHILYFNTDDVLCALNVSTKQTTVLATSDPDEINQKLGCTPNERITYYDQIHTVGVDLKQASNAHAFVLADSRTHLQSFLQGCMRMRGLEEQQSISIIVPEDTPDSLDSLMTLMTKNEQDQLKEDNFFAAIAKMDNLIREDFLQRIADIPDEQIDEKYKLGQAFKRYFIETKNQSLFEQYGNIYTEQLTSELLKQHQMMSLNNWKRCLTDAEIEPTEHAINALEISLHAIVEQSIPLCKEKSLSPASKSQELATEVEQEKETQKEVEKEQLREAENFDPELQAASRHTWTNTDGNSLLASFITNGQTDFMKPLKQEPPEMSLFSEHLLVDDNYAKVYSSQSHMLCPYLKPVEAILFRKSGDTVTACLIDMSDLSELKGLINTESDPMVWISNTQHTILEGVFPEGILQNTAYKTLIEQIRLFNGECNGLREQKTPLCWLNQNSNEKLASFKEFIMPYRQTKSNEFKALQAALSSIINKGAYPVEDQKVASIAATIQSKARVQTLKENATISQVAHFPEK